MVATNIVMDANAAISRRMSVIAGSFPLMFALCSHYVQRVKHPLPRFLEVIGITARLRLPVTQVIGAEIQIELFIGPLAGNRVSEFENSALVEGYAAIHSGGKLMVMGRDHRGQA